MSDHPVPPICVNWHENHTPITKGWDTPYKDHIEDFNKKANLVHNSNEIVDTSPCKK